MPEFEEVYNDKRDLLYGPTLRRTDKWGMGSAAAAPTSEAVSESGLRPLPRPLKNASRDDWEAYAISIGLDPGDKSRDDIIKFVESEER